MGNVQLKTWQECEDFVRGCVFMGTGGGGKPEWGERMLRSALDEGLTIEWVDADDIPDDVWTVTPYGMGSIAPLTQETLDEIERRGLENKLGDTSMEEAIRELGNYLGQPIGCLVCAELGGGNSAAPLVTGARMGIQHVGVDRVLDDHDVAPLVDASDGPAMFAIDEGRALQLFGDGSASVVAVNYRDTHSRAGHQRCS